MKAVPKSVLWKIYSKTSSKKTLKTPCEFCKIFKRNFLNNIFDPLSLLSFMQIHYWFITLNRKNISMSNLPSSLTDMYNIHEMFIIIWVKEKNLVLKTLIILLKNNWNASISQEFASVKIFNKTKPRNLVKIENLFA